MHTMQVSSKNISAMKTFKLLLQNLNETMPVETQLDKATKIGIIFINFTCIYSDRNEPVRKKKMRNWRVNLYQKLQAGKGFLNINVLFQMIQYTSHLTCRIFVSKIDAKQVWKRNYEMFEFNYVRGQVRCTKQDTHVLQGKVAIAIT